MRLMFEDEARFGRINDPRRCWAPAGIRPSVGRSIVREYTYAFAAVSPHDGVLDSLVLPTVDAESMSLFLAEVARRHAHEFILMVLDGAGWHTAHNVVVPENIRLVPLPPYSPELNPTEHLWDLLREHCFANLVFDTMDGVEDQLVTGLATLEADSPRVQRSTGFPWIIQIPLNAT